MKNLEKIGKILNSNKQKTIFGGKMAGPCRDSYPNQPKGCACHRNDQCASGSCNGSSGTNWWKTCA